MRAIRLKTEHLTAPMGVDFTAPQLFWNCEGGVRQTAWQILAADDGGNLLWDSGKTEGAAMRAKWGGSPVPAKTSVVWRFGTRTAFAASGRSPALKPASIHGAPAGSQAIIA